MDFGWVLTQKQVKKIFWIDSNLDKLMNFIFFGPKIGSKLSFSSSILESKSWFLGRWLKYFESRKKNPKKYIFQYSCKIQTTLISKKCKSPKKVNFDSKNQQK